MAGVQLEHSFARIVLGVPPAQLQPAPAQPPPQTPLPPPPPSGSCLRLNSSYEAQVDIGVLFGVGRYKDVYKGSYVYGERAGEECVCKFFRRRGAMSRAYFNAELQVVQKASEIVDLFNSSAVLDAVIKLNLPEVWKCEVRGPHGSDFCLVEPMIPNFLKFNSNTGWTPLHNIREPGQFYWIEAMQALSHFSYHCTGGALLLCDLQGGATEDGFTLTDPIVMSQQAGKFGPSDLGADGISTFFFRHRCNALCSRDWLYPVSTRSFYPCRRGSSLEMEAKAKQHHKPQRRSRQHAPPGIVKEEGGSAAYESSGSLGLKSQDSTVVGVPSVSQGSEEIGGSLGSCSSQSASPAPPPGVPSQRLVRVTLC